MRQLLLFFQRYYYVFLFICLEMIALGFLFSRNNYQKAKFLNSTSVVQTSIDQKRNNYTEFLNLKNTNTTLAQENAELYKQIEQLKAQLPLSTDSIKLDSTVLADFNIQPAKVISNPMNSSKTHITINKGLNQNVKEEAGIFLNNSIIGKVVLAENNYSLVMPIFHTNSRTNVRHEPSKYTGNLVWKGGNFKTVQVEKIPRNASVELGDTIVTNQYSKSFPESTLVGVVDKIDYDPTKNFYQLDVKPFIDFSKLNLVYVIQKNDLNEILQIEEQQ